MKNKKSKSKNETPKKRLIEKYKDRKAKKHVGNTALKTAVDLIVGTTLGAGISAGIGQASIPIGLLMIAGGHYLDEDTGIIRVAGSAVIAYGIGKAMTNKSISDATPISGLAGETSKAKKRLNLFKDEVFTAFYLDKIFKPKADKEQEQIAIEGIGEIDLSSLDVFEEELRQQNEQYALQHGDYLSPANDFEFSMIEEPDLSNI